MGAITHICLRISTATPRIVATHYRYKRPPRRKKVALAGPAIVRAADPSKARKRATTVRQPEEMAAERPPANNDRTPAAPSTHAGSRSAILTSRKRHRLGNAPDLTRRSSSGAAMPPTRCSRTSNARSPPSYGRVVRGRQSERRSHERADRYERIGERLRRKPVELHVAAITVLLIWLKSNNIVGNVIDPTSLSV
jgi:hypothetical protein